MATLRFTVAESLAGSRLDRALAGRREIGTRSLAERLVRDGAVTVDGAVRGKSHRLEQGSVVEVKLVEDRRAELVAEPVTVRLAYEDDDLVVVDKPAGMTVHPGAGTAAGTLAAQLLSLGATGGDDPERPGIVHRLDRETSGLLVVARSEAAHAALQSAIRAREVERRYLALVRGRPRSRGGRIDAPIGRDRRDPTRRSLDTDEPREAVTWFETRELVADHALLDVRLETGRTHQIRVHLAAIDLPVAGDAVYGVTNDLGLPRQFLHAYRLAFAHPVTGAELDLESPLPADLASARARARARATLAGGLASSPPPPPRIPRARARERAPARLSRSFSLRPGDQPWRGCRRRERGSARPVGETHSTNRKGADRVSVVSMRELLEAGVHFGHQTRRWNPKMRRYIFGERGGIYIIDLTKTQELLEESYEFSRNIAERGGTVLFVGTKKQAQNAVAEHATRVGMPYVSNRWLGGLLTNWRTISERIAYLHDLRRLKTDGQLALLPSKERIGMEADLEKLEANLGGVADMKRQPDAVFVIDLKKEQLAVRETHRLGVPVIGLVDTNADPDEANFVIPGNDDAIRSCDLVARVVADGIAAGRSKVTTAELAAAPAAAAPAADAQDAPAAEETAALEETAPPEAELEPAAVTEGSESE